MKRVIVILILFIVAGPAASVDAASQELARPGYRIVIDNEVLKLDAPPFLSAGTTMVPFRPIFERLGLEVAWNAFEPK